jgi:two-component system, cell cycle sensor histidine kinase and response regulator CckA
LRVLLVEDEEVVRNLVAQMLRNHGFTVLEAATPRKAIQLAQEDTLALDMLLTDVIMPEMRGPELAKTITLMRPDIKVVFMSGYSHSSSGEPLPAETVFIQKPFSAASLIATLRNALVQPTASWDEPMARFLPVVSRTSLTVVQKIEQIRP